MKIRRDGYVEFKNKLVIYHEHIHGFKYYNNEITVVSYGREIETGEYGDVDKYINDLEMYKTPNM